MNTNLDDRFNARNTTQKIAPTVPKKAGLQMPGTDKFPFIANMGWEEDALEVSTRNGPRLLRKVFPNQDFYAAWRDQKEELKALGYSLAKNPRTDCWEVCHWGLLPQEKREALEHSKALSRATDANIDAPRPEGLEYLGYQRAGIAFGMDRPATLIGDEMGLGKTIQAIGIMNTDTAARRIVVICPASLKLNWHRELSKWLVRKRTIFIADSKLFPELEDGIVIVNYDVLHKHADKLHSVVWDILVCDEAHYLKNRKARRSEMVFGFKPTKKEKFAGVEEKPSIQAKRKIFLTGTPIANRTAELFPIINYLDPVTWPNFFSYARRYCAAAQGAHGWDFSGASNLEELQDKLRSTIMIRRLKKDVLKELPPKRRQVIEIAADAKVKALLKRELQAYEDRAEELEALHAQAELAKASDNPADYAGAVSKLKGYMGALFGELSTIRKETAIAKVQMDEVRDHLNEAVENSGKIIVFAHHKEVVRLIKEQFGDAAVMIVGDTDMAERQENADRFQKDPACKVIIGSFGAMGVGWTLVASAHVIMVELDWVPGNVSQAEDRAHRIGQTDSVLVQHLVLEGSLDANIARKIVEKQDVIDRALDRAKAEVESGSIGAPRPKHKNDTAATDKETPDSLAEKGAKLTKEQIDAIHDGLRRLAGVCNGAVDFDGMGFSKIDTRIGKSLAMAPFLSRKQAALGMRLCIKYRGQLGDALLKAIRGDMV